MQSVLLVLCFAAFIAVQPGTAQETIFNVPSGDILDKWKVYGEFDFAYLWDASSGTYTPRLVAGVGHKIEIGINLNGITSPGPSQTTPTPTLKWKAYDGGRNGWGFIIGDDVFLPAQNRTYTQGSELLKRQQQMPCRPSKSIKSPDGDRIDPSFPSVSHKPIQFWPGFDGPGYAAIDIFVF